MKNPRIFKTVFQVVVLSDGPYDSSNLHQIAYDTSQGDCSGDVSLISSTELTKAEAIQASLDQGTDPSFFFENLDSEDECQHEADVNTISQADGAEWTVDVWCKKCGRSGSIPVDKNEVQW